MLSNSCSKHVIIVFSFNILSQVNGDLLSYHHQLLLSLLLCICEVRRYTHWARDAVFKSTLKRVLERAFSIRCSHWMSLPDTVGRVEAGVLGPSVGRAGKMVQNGEAVQIS